MYRLIATIILANMAILPNRMSAQFAASLKYGVNVSNVSTNGLADVFDFAKGPKMGHFVEGLVNYRVSNDFSVGMGVGFKQKGFRLQEKTKISAFGLSLPIGARMDFNINSLEIPLVTKYHINNAFVDAYIVAGAGISFNLNSSLNTSVMLLGDIELPPIGTSDIINSNEIFGTVGLGLSKNAGKGKFFGEMRYERSFENYTSDFLVDIPLKNSGFTVGVGYLMPLN